MAKQLSEEEIYEEASKRVRARKRFYGGLATYLIVNAVLIVIWALSGAINVLTRIPFLCILFTTSVSRLLCLTQSRPPSVVSSALFSGTRVI